MTDDYGEEWDDLDEKMLLAQLLAEAETLQSRGPSATV